MRGFPDKLKKEYLAVALLVGILCLILGKASKHAQ